MNIKKLININIALLYMSDSNQNLKTIKIFYQFLGIVITRLNNGDMVDEDRIKQLVGLIYTFMPKLKPEGEKKDPFLETFKSGDYESRSKRNSSIDYKKFKQNLSFY